MALLPCPFTEWNTWKTQNSYASPHCSVWSLQTVTIDKPYRLVYPYEG